MNEKTLGDTKKTTTFSHEQLWEALKDSEDLMDRVQARAFLVGKTARDIFDDKLLEGEDVSWGLKRNDLAESTLSMLKTLKPDIQITDKEIWYKYKEIPVIIQIFDNDYEFFKNLDKKYYQVGEYLVPNPFEKYWKTRFIAK